MKKLVLILFAGLFVVGSFAQNVQTHYHLGNSSGNFLTTTVEMFKPDKSGSTYFFIDMNYGEPGVRGVSMAYWEISHSWTIAKSPFAAHLEYNGGFGQFMPDGKYLDNGVAYQINDAYLGGVDYSWNAKDFSKGFTFQTLYKTIRDKNKASFQLTAVWYIDFFRNKLRFDGFADFWREDNVFGTTKTKFVFLSEPQLWYNFNKNMAVGSEVRFRNNFGGLQGFAVQPTAALKYTF
jgi:hypothetical protein